MPDPQQPQGPPPPNLGEAASAFAWLTTKFGPTDAILISALLVMAGLWLGFIPNPIMNRIIHIETEVARVCVRVMCNTTSPDYETCSEKCWTGKANP